MHSRARCAIALSLPVAVVLAVATAPAANLTFEQVSWVNSDHSGYVSRYSDWGQVTLTLTSGDHNLTDFAATTVGGLGNGYVGYVNVVTDASGAAAWNVQNLPIFYKSPSELDGRLPQDVWFDLGVAPGTTVGSLNAYFTIDPTPQLLMPGGTLVNQPVTEFDHLTAGAVLWLGPNRLSGGGLAAPPPAANFPGAAAGEHVGFVGRINGPENAIAPVEEDDNGCAPGSAARSLKYLSDQHPEVTAPGTAQQMYDGLAGAMNTSTTDGTSVDDFLEGKIDYCVANGLPIMSAQTTSFGAAIDTLNRNGDVELGVYWGKDAQGRSMGGHATMVTEIQELHDANGNVTGYVVKAVDDPTQGDGNAANSAHTYKFDANGKLVQFDGAAPGTGACLLTFQVEDVRKWVDPLEVLWGGMGMVCMPAGGGLPNPVGVGMPAGPKVAAVNVVYAGAVDTGSPTNPVGSCLIANPRNDPGPCETLELDLADVVFTPEDPGLSTVLGVGLTLEHLTGDDVTRGAFMPILGDEEEILLKNFILTSSFFDITYQIELPGEDPHVYRLHGEVPEELLGKAWIVADDTLDPEAWVESFFDVFFEMELTPEAYPLLGADEVLLHMNLHASQVPAPPAMALLAAGLPLLWRRRRRPAA